MTGTYALVWVFAQVVNGVDGWIIEAWKVDEIVLNLLCRQALVWGAVGMSEFEDTSERSSSLQF